MHRFMQRSENMELTRKLSQKTVLITGATGLIGSNLVKYLLSQEIPGLTLVALVRSCSKARLVFGDLIQNPALQFLEGDICDLPTISRNIDYIIHAACPTSSREFVLHPVEISSGVLHGTLQMLNLARDKQVAGFVYLSSMEVYGAPTTDDLIYETHPSSLITMDPRSSYPEAKRMSETLCASYASEYGVPAKVIRLTQTFGEGVRREDGRVFAEFARCALESKDIVLHTKGETKRSYLHVKDAVKAILTVLLEGKPGEAYNASNESTYCTIYEMAQMVAKKLAHGDIRVVIELADEKQFGYAPVLHMNLDTTKLRSLGWEPQYDLEEMYRSMISHWNDLEGDY